MTNLLCIYIHTSTLCVGVVDLHIPEDEGFSFVNKGKAVNDDSSGNSSFPIAEGGPPECCLECGESIGNGMHRPQADSCEDGNREVLCVRKGVVVELTVFAC